MPPVVAAAAVTGLTSGAALIAGARIQSGSNKRAIQAQTDAASRAEAFELARELNDRKERDRVAAEEQRRWDVEQANLARRQEQEDAILRDNLERAAYEDAIRYGKMVNIARLTGQPIPQPPPKRTALPSMSDLGTPKVVTANPSAPIASKASTANAMVAAPGTAAMFEESRRMPLRGLVGHRRAI